MTKAPTTEAAIEYALSKFAPYGPVEILSAEPSQDYTEEGVIVVRLVFDGREEVMGVWIEPGYGLYGEW